MVKYFGRLINKINTDLKEHLIKTAITISILATAYLLSGNIFLSFIIGSAAAILLLGWDSRVFIGAGLIFLIACPFLLAFEKKSTAEEMAVYAYYMLALGVILQIIQFGRDSIFTKKKAGRKAKTPAIEFWAQKRTLAFALGMAGLAVIAFGAGFYFLDRRMENKYNAYKKFISDLVDSRLKDAAPIKAKIIAEQPQPADEFFENAEINWENVKVLVENPTGQEGAEVAAAKKIRELGIPNVRTIKIFTPPNQNTSVLYCSGCQNIAAEVAAAMQNPDEIYSEENPSLIGEIRIELGADQAAISQKNE